MKAVVKRKLYLFVIISAVILLLIFFGTQNWFAFPRTAVHWASAPFMKTFQWAHNRLARGMDIFLGIKDLSAENARLQSENYALWQENTDLKEAAKENEILRARLAITETETRPVFARIIGSENQTGRIFLIDQGSQKGIAPGMAAATQNNFLIGKITEVHPLFSKVMLISDPNSSFNVLTQDTRVNGAVKGSHGLAITMEMIPVDQKINQGETVLTSGLNDTVPKGLIVGKISEVILKENEIFQKAVIQPAADLTKLESLFILVR